MGVADRHGRLPWLCVATLTGAIVASGISCTAENRYRVLTVFFEGVPPPGAVAGAPESPSAPEDRLERPISFHPAFRQERCADCHLSDRESLKAPVPNLCWQCHEKPPERDGWNHAPARVGDCQACHVAHEAMTHDLLLFEGKVLCYTCHRNTYIEGLTAHRDVDLDVCRNCHDPHRGGTQTVASGQE